MYHMPFYARSRRLLCTLLRVLLDQQRQIVLISLLVRVLQALAQEEVVGGVLIGQCEAHPHLIPVEDGVVLAEEGVAQDDDGAARGRDVDGHETGHAVGTRHTVHQEPVLLLVTLPDDVVFLGHDQHGALLELDLQVRQQVVVGTVLLHTQVVQNAVHHVTGTRQERRPRVDGRPALPRRGLQSLTDLERHVGYLDVREPYFPVLSALHLRERHVAGHHFRVHAPETHLPLLVPMRIQATHVEGEDVVLQDMLFHDIVEDWLAACRGESRETQAENAGEGGAKEGVPRLLHDRPEHLVGDLRMAYLQMVRDQLSLDAPRPVGDLEHGDLGVVVEVVEGRGGAVVVLVVLLAPEGSTEHRGEPKVGTPGVEDHFEVLQGAAQRDASRELGVLVVRDGGGEAVRRERPGQLLLSAVGHQGTHGQGRHRAVLYLLLVQQQGLQELFLLPRGCFLFLQFDAQGQSHQEKLYNQQGLLHYISYYRILHSYNHVLVLLYINGYKQLNVNQS